MRDHILRETPWLERLLDLKGPPDLKWNADIRAIAKKMLQEWSVHCITPENTEFSLPCSIVIRVRSNQEWSTAAKPR